ncbi:UNVERIFIED_CONTAM: hypothetical protein FKN15_051986 [Acipenser sinensis]
MVHWLNPAEKTGQQMGEAIVLEQFCHVVGAETQGWIRRHNPTTLEAAVRLAEDYEDSLVSVKTGPLTPLVAPITRGSAPSSLQLGTRPPRSPTSMGRPTSLPWRQRLAPSWGRFTAPDPLQYQQRDRPLTPVSSAPIVCFRCHEPGHIARVCPAAMECNVATCYLASEAGKELRLSVPFQSTKSSSTLLDLLTVDAGCQST